MGYIVAAEWSENAADILAGEDAVRVDIVRTGDNDRRITVEGGAL